jgi:hypothetical protein
LWKFFPGELEFLPAAWLMWRNAGAGPAIVFGNQELNNHVHGKSNLRRVP